MIRIKKPLESGIKKTGTRGGERKTKLSLKHLALEFLRVWHVTWRRKDFKEISWTPLIFLKLVKENQTKFFMNWKRKMILFQN